MQSLYNEFPNLRTGDWKPTSPVTPEYNCIAWVANEDDVWWWPDSMGQYYWPAKAPREITVEAFIVAYGTLGYVPCDTSDLEAGYEKIAIYALNGLPTHAARQISSGRWSSKLGPNIDIEHSLEGLEGKGSVYGEVAQICKRLIVK